MKQRLCVCSECKRYSVKHLTTGVLVNGQYLSRRQWARHQEVQQEADAIAQTRSVVDATVLRTIISVDNTVTYENEGKEDGEVPDLAILDVLSLTFLQNVQMS
jgi:hypothetical protein